MIDPNDYYLKDTSHLNSPGLVLFKPLLMHNLHETIRLCGGPDRWRPHVKTHKTREIVRLQLELGVTRHKCATIAEAEMLAMVGAPDVLIAYPLVGPNVMRLSKLIELYPATRFAVIADDATAAIEMGTTLSRSGQSAECLLDLNPGMDRTGVFLNETAVELYELLSSTPGLSAGGLHWYDGQHRQADREERRMSVMQGWEQLTRFRDRLLMHGLEVPRVVASGSGSFHILAETEEPGLELSPGTTTLSDADCDGTFAELNLRPAVAVFTRVISHSGNLRLTLDAGHKSVAPDKPAGGRLRFPSLPDAREMQHTEEHLVIETQHASHLKRGDGLFAISFHVCPTMALHDFVSVAENGEIDDQWQILGRRRVINV
jgi:D-serine deaminase-like pyridoxal phosphate-dependent protein